MKRVLIVVLTFTLVPIYGAVLTWLLMPEPVEAQLIQRLYSIHYQHMVKGANHYCFVVTEGGGIVEAKDEVCH